MTKKEFHKKIGLLRIKHQKGINDLYIWCSIAVDSLERALTDEEFLETRYFSVPSRRPKKRVKRDREKARSIVSDAKNKDLYYSVFTYLVAQVEAFIQGVLYQSLLFDNKKLKTRVNGVDHIKKITVEEIIDRPTRKDLIESIIEKELTSLFYARPSVQFKYLEEVTGVSIEDELKEGWREFKATRDLIVHNSGIINKLYIMKAGALCRGKEGQLIIVDKEYIGTAMASMKSLIGQVCSQIQKGLDA